MILDGTKGRKSVHGGVLGLGRAPGAGYYRLDGKPLMHMGEGEAGWQDGMARADLCKAGNGGSSCLKADLGGPGGRTGRANRRRTTGERTRRACADENSKQN